MKTISSILFKLSTSFLFAAGIAVSAQNFPNKQIKIIVPYPPGGVTDSIGRKLSAELTEKLGSSSFVENKPGAGSIIAVQTLLSSPADGHSIALLDPRTVAMNQFMYRSLPYDPVKLQPISLLTRVAFGIVTTPDFPANDVSQLVKFLAANPNYPSAVIGQGSDTHLAMELFAARVGVTVQAVPYKGSGPALIDMLGGQVKVAMIDIPSSIQYIRSGKLKLIALTGAKRLDILPNATTVSESGYPGFDVGGWLGVFVPLNTPVPVVAKLNQAIQESARNPQFSGWIREASLEPSTNSPEQFADLIRADSEKYEKIIRKMNFSLD